MMKGINNRKAIKKDIMLQNIDLVQEKDMFCYETALASVASLWGRNYEMIFSETWNFILEYDNQNIIGSSILTSEWNMEELFEKYHGVSVEWNDINPKTFIDIAKSELVNNKPLVCFYTV